MRGHRIYIVRQRYRLGQTLAVHIRRCAKAALSEEGITDPCQINILITDDEGIREYNRKFRNIDSATDVLSFPAQELEPGKFDPSLLEKDPETDTLLLGDMVISYERAERQAEEYGHSVARELAYLTVHSVLHLLGYDHMDEETDKPLMRSKEEKILSSINMTR